MELVSTPAISLKKIGEATTVERLSCRYTHMHDTNMTSQVCHNASP